MRVLYAGKRYMEEDSALDLSRGLVPMGLVRESFTAQSATFELPVSCLMLNQNADGALCAANRYSSMMDVAAESWKSPGRFAQPAALSI